MRNVRVWRRHVHSRLRVVSAAILAPAAVTLLALVDVEIPTASAAVLYVLAVVVAASIGGSYGGVGASLLSFLALNFFFTPPQRTFEVAKTADLVALFVFLVVAVVVGMLLSAAYERQARIERRELEARLLNLLTTRLLSGDPLESVLEDFAQRLVETFRLCRCEIIVESVQQPIVVNRDDCSGEGRSYTTDMKARGRQIGSLVVVADSARGLLDKEERDATRVFAGQIALAVESMRLSEQVRRAHLDVETTQLRAALFSSVTHDLRTPLASILASVTSLLDGGRGFSQRDRFEHLDTIKHEAERLNRLVTNILDLSRIRSGALLPAKVPASVDEVIESVLRRVQTLLADRDVRVDIRDDLPEVPMDVVQIDQVLTNLIENALKFSPPGSPLTIAAVGWHGGVRVTVADAGPGVPKDERERIFEPFERGSGLQTGTGLGLTIARAIVVAHDGRIWIQDAPGGGARVVFELPVTT